MIMHVHSLYIYRVNSRSACAQHASAQIACHINVITIYTIYNLFFVATAAAD